MYVCGPRSNAWWERGVKVGGSGRNTAASDLEGETSFTVQEYILDVRYCLH